MDQFGVRRAELVRNRGSEVSIDGELIQRIEQREQLSSGQDHFGTPKQACGKTGSTKQVARMYVEISEQHPNHRQRQPERCNRRGHGAASAAATSTFNPVSVSATFHNVAIAASLPGRTSGLRTGGPLPANSGP